ncbi:MAG: SDR family oxidoreductase [Mycobacterium sp.]|nr:SDR family oxidoreductase [Mycobacterium sp.]
MMHAFLKFPDGASVVITGAGSGIGRSTARICAEAGLRVALWDLIPEPVEALREELTHTGAKTFVAKVDVRDEADIAAGFAATQNAFGHIDYLVNNAGPANATAVTFAEGLVMAAGSMANVTSGWLALGRRDGDAIVNVSSVAGNITGAGAQPWYPSAKAAIAGFTRHLALRRPGGIRANAVAPGLVDTPRMVDYMKSDAGRSMIARNPMGRAGLPDDVGAAICFLLSPAACYINGVVLPVDGGAQITE